MESVAGSMTFDVVLRSKDGSVERVVGELTVPITVQMPDKSLTINPGTSVTA